MKKDVGTPDPWVARGVPELHVSSERLDDGKYVVTVIGEVDLASAAKLKTVLDGVLGDAATGLVVDLTECSLIDSTGVQVLLTAYRQANGSLRQLSLVPSKRVSRVLEISGLARMYETHASRTAAIANAQG